MKRRTFLHNLSLSGMAALTAPQTLTAGVSLPAIFEIGDDPGPTPAQRAWMDLGFGLFIHFGINTYYDVEWSDGTLDPSRFNPSRLDTDQWCRAAKHAGMKYILLVTKHHDGFCLWPTRHTDYSVAAGSWKGDLVGEVVNSARKYGLKVGFYYSLWDSHEPSHDEDEWAYVNFMKKQLKELLTQYGEVVELWFDGFWKKQQHGWTKRNKELEGSPEYEDKLRRRNQNFIDAWRREGAYRWQMDHLYQYVKSLQPGCIVMNNPTGAYPGVPLHPVDARCGEKYTSVAKDQKTWQWLGKDIYLPLQIETTLSTKGNKRFPSGNWFWHEWDDSVLSKEKVQQYREVARTMKANLVLNVGPSDKGLLRPQDEALLKSLGE